MNIKTPLKKEDIEKLKAGDIVKISGIIYTARDAAHKKLCELLEKNEELPFNPEGAVIYYAGPTPEKPGQVIGSAGPTTSGRMDAYTPRLLESGLKGMIGKGERSDKVKEAIIKNKNQQGIIKNDDFNDCLGKMIKADGIILGSPVYSARAFARSNSELC